MYPICTTLSYNNIFARNVKARREARGLTRKEMAEECMGYPEEMLARVEAGDTTGCTIDFLVCLAKYLEAPLETLMTDRYFCPHYERKSAHPETSQESETTEKPCHLFLVVAGFAEANEANFHHSVEIIAESEKRAIATAIARDKIGGVYSEEYHYFACRQLSALDKKGE